MRWAKYVAFMGAWLSVFLIFGVIYITERNRSEEIRVGERIILKRI